MFVLLLSLSALPRPDSPPLLDKVGLTEEHGHPERTGFSEEVVQTFFPPSPLTACQEQTDSQQERVCRQTSADFSPGHTPQAFLVLSTTLFLEAFKILICYWLVIESHCFWGKDEKEGRHCCHREAHWHETEWTCKGLILLHTLLKCFLDSGSLGCELMC